MVIQHPGRTNVSKSERTRATKAATTTVSKQQRSDTSIRRRSISINSYTYKTSIKVVFFLSRIKSNM
jgi:hypothetical protein